MNEWCVQKWFIDLRPNEYNCKIDTKLVSFFNTNNQIENDIESETVFSYKSSNWCNNKLKREIMPPKMVLNAYNCMNNCKCATWDFIEGVN